MTQNDLMDLHAGWFANFAIPPGIYERSRRIREHGLPDMRRMKFLDLPDFGWTVAMSLGVRREFISFLDKPPYKWVAAGARFWISIGHSTGDDQTQIVQQASELNRTSCESRKYIRAALLVPNATAESAARAFGLETPVVEAYSDLFFNVMDRRDSPDYLRAAYK